MNGNLFLAGGAEFGGGMAALDLRLLQLSGAFAAESGRQEIVCIVPTAAAFDGNHERAGANGVRWFRKLGVRQVASLPLIDRLSADTPEVVSALRIASLIYLLGGSPGYLAQALAGSRSWQAALQAYGDGAALGGSSAGAMVLGGVFYDPYREQVMPGLGVLPGVCIVPHHTRYGKNWAPRLRAQMPSLILLGIDEQTGVIDDGEDGAWRVYGQGSATVYDEGGMSVYRAGDQFRIIQAG